MKGTSSAKSTERISSQNTMSAERGGAQGAKVDILGRRRYAAVTSILVVSDVQKAAAFYKRIFGFESRGTFKAAGKPVHTEITLGGTTLMLTPEIKKLGVRAKARDLTHSMYVIVDDVDKTIAKAVGLGAKKWKKVEDMFWGDRCGWIIDPYGHCWTVATHKADYTLHQLQKSKYTFTEGAVGDSKGFATEETAPDPPPFKSTKLSR